MENEIYIDIRTTNDAQIFTQVRLRCFMKYKEQKMLKVVYFQLLFDLKRHKSIEISVPVIDQLVKHTHMHRDNVVKRQTFENNYITQKL